jgi:hypothetical protein
MQLTLRNFSKYHIDMVVEEQGKDPWRLTVWYGEANRSLRYKTWDMMRYLKADSDLPCCCIGDFNEVLRREEQMGPNEREMAQINLFREVVDACQLCDIGYVGLDWTFERRVQGGEYCRVRLDRVLASTEWLEMFPLATLHHLHAVKSDHSTILLMNEMEAQNQRIAVEKPFRYEVMWERHEEFQSTLEAAWGPSGAGNVEELQAKLLSTAMALKGWGNSSFGAVRTELRGLRKKLQELRMDTGRSDPTYEEKKVEERIAELGHREEIMWRQRARIQWLAEGDKNTRIFHHKASMRRKKNKIDKLTRADGSVCENVNELEQMAHDFYEDLYKSENTIGIEEVLSHVPRKVNGEMNETLNAAYTEEEVKTTLFQIFPSKAPGPDGCSLLSKALESVWKGAHTGCYSTSQWRGFYGGNKQYVHCYHPETTKPHFSLPIPPY